MIATKPSTERDYRERIVRTLEHIQRHLDEDLTLEELAGIAAFSRFHFHRIFRGLVGEPLHEHVRRLRLERAAQSLKRGDDAITDLALAAGFETHEAFTRAFGEMFGVSPSAYRASNEPLHRHQPASYGDPLPVEVKDLPSLRVVYLRHIGVYSQVGATWGRLMSWAGMRGLLGPQMRMLGIVYDDPDITPSAKIRYDAAVVIDRPVTPEGDFGVTELPGGKYALFTHQGPYETLSQSYARFFGGWLPASGYEVRDAEAFEEYLNSPMNAPPENLLTRIHIPID